MSLRSNPAKIKSLADAKKLVARPDSIKVQSNLDFYYGEHWQAAEGWSGPIPASYDSSYAVVAAEIERGFVSKNTIKEITDRLVNGVTGRDFKFTLSYPANERKTKILKEAEEVIKKWLKDKDAKKYVQKALRHAALSGKSTLRLFIPAGLLNNGEITVDEKNPLGLLYLDAPSPLAAGIIEDDSTKEQTGVFIGRAIDDMGREKELAEVTYLLPEADAETGIRFTEITILPERGIPESAQLNLNGKLFIFELEMPRLITDQIRSLQKFQNLNLTMMQRNSVLGGFLERVILNGQLPGHYEDDGAGGQVFVRDEFATGAGTVNAINGVPTLDENGNVSGYTTASISYRDPVSVQTFLQGSEAAYHGILEESHQLHSLLSGDAVTSGDSRRQALAAFMSSLRIPKQVTEQAIEWLIETVLACAGTFSGEPDKFKGISVKAECKLDFGAISAGEIDLLERQVRIGIISVQTARERIGIEDLEEEERRVQEGLATVNAAANTFGGTARLDTGTDNRDKINNDQQEEEE